LREERIQLSSNRSLINIGVALAIAAIYVFLFVFPVNLDFPFYNYLTTPLRNQLIPLAPFDDIAARTSSFLWGTKALDLIDQAFVLLAAVLGCLALLKDEGVKD
jgi:hypothetical protein